MFSGQSSNTATARYYQAELVQFCRELSINTKARANEYANSSRPLRIPRARRVNKKQAVHLPMSI